MVIDVGEPKKSAAEDLDALQQQTGIPFIHVTATLAASGDAYRMLGSVLGMPEQAEELAEYCDTVYANTVNLTDSVEKTSLLYGCRRRITIKAERELRGNAFCICYGDIPTPSP